MGTIRHFAKSYLPFLPSQRKRMMQISDVLLPNSQTEADQLQRFFLVPSEKISVVPNGVDAHYEQATPELFEKKYQIRDFVLCVGRIEPRKNQLGMIRALKGSGLPLVFIGDYVSDYQDYYNQCRREADQNMHFLGPISHESGLLPSAYAACNTFLLASWLETPGLAALEAALAGAKVVITIQGATQEYFQNFAAYVDPDSAVSIREKTLQVFQQKKDHALRNHIRQNYLWSVVAKKTLQAYQQVLNQKALSTTPLAAPVR